MSARRCTAPIYRRSGGRRHLRSATAHQTNAPRGWSTASRRCSHKRSRTAARRCAITGSRTASSACFSITSAFTIAPANHAGPRAAAVRSSASSRTAARPSIVRCARSSFCEESMSETIIVETRGRVGLIRLNRPQALNALNSALIRELAQAIDAFEADNNVGCIVITGSDKAFAAGADIKEMAGKGFTDVFLGDFAATWHRVAAARKPVVTAVAGFALGGGCELVIAADNAKFGQPEIKLGVIPGIGGTQRLTHAVGKAKAMDLILTGRMMDAQEAERAGLVARIMPLQSLLDEAIKVAATIAAMSLPSVLAAKEAVNRAFEASQAEGVRFERRVLHSLFATRDQKEGMAAFIEKRPPKFENK